MKQKITLTFLMLTMILIAFTSCSDGKKEDTSKNKEQDNEETKETTEDTFDVHGIKLKVKEEPEEIEEASTITEDEFSIEPEVLQNIVDAITERDEETFRKYNYFGDRVVDEAIEQTVHMNDDNPMNESDISSFTFKHPDELVHFKQQYEKETDQDFKENRKQYDNSMVDKQPTFYRTEDIFKYADYIELDNTDLKIDYDQTYVTVGEQLYVDLIDPKEENDDDDHSVRLVFDKYKEDYYYLNGVAME